LLFSTVSTLADWVGAVVATLMALILLIRAYLFAAERIHAGDTTVPVLAKGRSVSSKGYDWASRVPFLFTMPMVEHDCRMIGIAFLFVRVLCDRFKSQQRLEAEILVLRHQLNVLQQRAPRRLYLSWADRGLFIWLYRHFPRVLKSFVAGSDWQKVTIPFSDIGTDGSDLSELMFAEFSVPGRFSFLIDEIRLEQWSSEGASPTRQSLDRRSRAVTRDRAGRHEKMPPPGPTNRTAPKRRTKSLPANRIQEARATRLRAPPQYDSMTRDSGEGIPCTMSVRP
jgi:transposase IS66 family protein